MNELFNRIIAWHEKNLPADLPYEPLPQIGFLLEELKEVNDAFIKNDIDAAVGEICDLIVFSVNALNLIDKDIIDWIMDNLEKNIINNPIKIIKRLNRLVNDVSGSMDYVGVELADRYSTLTSHCIMIIGVLGYSPELALLETIKKIESRRGAWNPESGKWEKEKNQTDVYKPDYSLAKLKTTV